jgi:hypothetical protein
VRPAARAVARRTTNAVRYGLVRAGRDRGANPVELAVMMPAILILLFASMQTAAWFLARTVATNAAQEAVSAQRAYQAPAGVGEDRAVAFLNQAGDWLVGWNVNVAGVGTDTVTATVTGEPLRIVPLIPLPGVSQSAHGTVERFTDS